MRNYTPQRTRLYRGASTGAGRALGGGRSYTPRSYGDPYYDAGYAVGSYIGNMIDRNNDKKMEAEMNSIRNNINGTYGGFNMNQGEQNYLNSDNAIVGNPDGPMAQQVLNPPSAKDQAQGLVLDSMKNDYLTYGPNARQAKLAEEEIMQNAQKASAMNLGMTPWEQVKQQIDSQVDGSKMSYRRKQLMKEQLYSQFQGQAANQANKIAGDLYMQRFTMEPEEWKKKAISTGTQLLQAGQTNAAKMLMEPIEKDYAQQQLLRNRQAQMEQDYAFKERMRAEHPEWFATARGGSGRSSGGSRSTLSAEEKNTKTLDKLYRQLQGQYNQLNKFKDDDSEVGKKARDTANKYIEKLEKQIRLLEDGEVEAPNPSDDGVVVASGVKAGNASEESKFVSAGYDKRSAQDIDEALQADIISEEYARELMNNILRETSNEI